jgi:dipeptidase E
MGGGGFAMEPENPLLDQYILSLNGSGNGNGSGKPSPKICFIGTASGDSDGYRDKFYTAFKALNCVPSHLSLFKPHTRDFKSFLLDQDIVHVGGGNTKNLLCLWKEWGLDTILKEVYRQGVVLTGMSAGMICWFEECTTDSFGGLDPLKCLGFLKGSASPHFDGEPGRRPKYIELIRSGQISGGLALDDGCGALFTDEVLSECVSSRKTAGAYRFESKTAAEEKIPVRYLGDNRG